MTVGVWGQKLFYFRLQFLRQVPQLRSKSSLKSLAGPHQLRPEFRETGAAALLPSTNDVSKKADHS